MRERRERIIREQGEEAWRRIVAGHNIRRYGITFEDFEALLEAQGGGCAICGTQTPTGNHGRLVVDHDHATGAVRGILCGRCNQLLGIAQDDTSLLKAAVKYLYNL
jgi:hypothetical protein